MATESCKVSREAHRCTGDGPDPVHLSPLDMTLLTPHKTATVSGFLVPLVDHGLEVLLRP